MNITEKAKNIIDNCRFCWMCRHVCPIGNATGLERNTARARAMAVSLVVRGATDLKEVAENIYECSLCGACTNNCMTGFDPKVFIQETKTEVVLNGHAPGYVTSLLEKYQEKGSIYNEEICSCLDGYFSADSSTALLVGHDALYKAPKAVKNALTLLEKAGEKVALDNNQDTGATLWFLTGKTAETLEKAKALVESLNKYKKVIVYDPIDYKLIVQEYKQWGLDVQAEIIPFNNYLLSLLKDGKIKVNKGATEYTVQDNYAYARDLDDCVTVREIVNYVGVNKEMLLHGKEANMAGNLIMNEYMPNVIKQVALDRWTNAINMGCKTLVTENPAEYVMLKATAPENYRVISVEEMLLENM